jgi:tRNA (mo5U34)-methyltransferase
MEFPFEISKIINKRSEWINRPGFAKYKQILNGVPEIKADFLNVAGEFIELDSKNPIDEEDFLKIKETCKNLIPWRKGPFKIFGLDLDSEWRSNLKWDRIKDGIPNLEEKNILDIGANNGYYMFKMAAHGPNLVLGIDPIFHNYAQFCFIQKFAKIPSLRFELLGIEHLKFFKEFFDVVFSMGIIYHHKNPIEQLQDIRNSLRPGGVAILESIGIPGENPIALFPENSYAKMSNIWFIPTLSCLINWAHKAKFKNIDIISSIKMTLDEQRNTIWCPKPHQSLEDFLDKDNRDKTIEGYDAPRRFCLRLEK